MSLNTIHVMNSILERSFKEGRSDVSPMKAQKLLFYTHGWHLAITGEPAVNDHFQVWKFGPVVENVYHRLKRFGNHGITTYIEEYDPQAEKQSAYVVSRDNTAFYESLDIAWEKYIGISAESLSTMTHEVGTPWYRAKSEGLSNIPDDYIREYFVGLAKQKT